MIPPATRGIAGGALAVLLGSVVLVGCSSQPESDPESLPEPTVAPFLIDQDFPDPDVLEADGQYVAFATNTAGVNVQYATSADLVDWTVSLDDALPELPEWASEGRTWAPDVSARADGTYIMYFVAAHTASDRQCIGAATATDPVGPFVPVEGEPLVCTLDQGGAIDPAAFTDDDGSRHLVWKNDGNCCAMETWVQITPLTADGTALAGPDTKLFMQTEDWEGHLVEAPVLTKHGDTYVMFYSANDYGTDQYAIGVATADTLTGPYVKKADPILSSESSGGRYIGPGGQDVVATTESDVLMFHAWDELMMYRGIHTLALTWTGDVPAVQLP